ncbi:MAG: hypothetical protein CM1200mP22_14790 [Dehalococcoidia bacterium]|nr:MAG: hypothetical protein CM1200mP22_14790 [Dehalococcoidia bacterium]
MATEPGESNGHPENSWETKGKTKPPGENSGKPGTCPPSAGLEQELEDLLAQATIDLDSLPVEEQVNLLKTRLEQAEKEAADNLDTAQRAQAEMVNFRRRTDEDRITNSKYANSRLISNVLPVLEELELAINHSESSGNGTTILC